MTTNAPRRVPVPAIVLAAVGALVILAAVVVALIAGGIISYGSGASNRADIERDKALQAADHYGGTACNRLDMFLGRWHGTV